MKDMFLHATLIKNSMASLFRNGGAVMRSKALLLLAAFLLCGLNVLAQIRTGTITGLIMDSSGAVVPNAQVKVTNVNTNVTRDLVTDSAGLYVAPNLVPGNYSVAVSLTGFRPESKVGLVVSLGQTITMNFTLQPGTQRQEITVVGTAQQMVDATTSTMGQVITERPVQELPLNGRNYLTMLALSAGVTPPPQGANQFFINGARGSGTAYLIDGVDVTSPSMDPTRILPNLEAIGEFKVTTNNFNAEYGRALGGIVNTHIKSGSNTWHGSLFEFLRNDKVEARGKFLSCLESEKKNGKCPKIPFRFNQFGGSVGGPILKDKLFVFTDYNGGRSRAGGTVYTNVPTTAEAHGNFSDLLRYLPGTTTIDPASQIYDPLTFPRAAFQNNTIPTLRLDPASAYMFSLMPAPNASGLYNFVVPAVSGNGADGMDGRVDFNPTAKDRLSAVVVYNNNRVYIPPFLGPQMNGNLIGGGNLGVRARSYSLTYTRTVSPAMVNEFSASWSRSILYGLSMAGQEPEPTLGIPYINPASNDPLLTGFPLFIFVGGYSYMGGPAGTPSSQNHNIPQFSDSLSWVKGRHSFKTGFSASFRQYNLDQSLFPRGLYVFVPYATSSFPANMLAGGNSIASALLGYPYQIQSQRLFPFGERVKEYGAYFQDDFKVSKRLTLNLGVRWDLYMPSVEQSNRLGNFDPTTLTVRIAGVNGNSNSTLDVNKRNFSPRVGFSYQATSDGKTVVRGGYAIGYLNLITQEVGTVDHRLPENPPYSLSSTKSYFVLGPVPILGITVPRVSDGFPVVPQDPNHLCCGVTVYYIPQSQPTPYMQQWNLDLQRALPGNFLLDIAYVGTRGDHLTGTSNMNQAPPGPTSSAGREPLSPLIGQAHAMLNREFSIYHALQVKVERRFTSGFYMLAGYTYSHSIDDGSISSTGANAPIASGGGMPQDSFNWRAERGNSDFDLRHRMVVSFIYELPFGKGKKFLSASNKFVDGFLGGWQLNGIAAAQTGSVWTPRLADSSYLNAGPGGIVRPYLVGDPNLPSSEQTVDHWYNVAAFAQPGDAGTPNYTYGTLGRNTMRGPHASNLDLSLFKNFRITERLKLEFRSEFFNIFNHQNLALPNPGIGAAQAGTIRGASAPRQIQFALKLLF
jgi:hypothetical protein